MIYVITGELMKPAKMETIVKVNPENVAAQVINAFRINSILGITTSVEAADLAKVWQRDLPMRVLLL